jgi:hypothetical protein
VLAERRKQRLAVTPAKHSVRYVKFTPEEMAIDAADIDASKPLGGPVFHGKAEWEAFLSFKRGYVRLDADLREVFKDDRSVNRALRKLVEALSPEPQRRKSA